MFRSENPPPGSPQADEARIKEFVSSVKVDLQAAVNQVVKDELLILRDELMTAIERKREAPRPRQAEPAVIEPAREPVRAEPTRTEPARPEQVAIRGEAQRPEQIHHGNKRNNFKGRTGFAILGALVFGVVAGVAIGLWTARVEPRQPVSTARQEVEPRSDRTREVITDLLVAQAHWQEFLHSKQLVAFIATLRDRPGASTDTVKLLATYNTNPENLRTGDESDLVSYVLQRTLKSSTAPDEILESLERAFLRKKAVTRADLQKALPGTSVDQLISLLGRAFLMEQAHETASR